MQNIISLIKNFNFAYSPDDSEETRSEKHTIFLVAGSCCLAGCIWSAMYLVVFGVGLTAALPLLFVLIVGGSLVVSQITKNHHYVVNAQIICIMYITVFIQWSIGGVFDSGVVLVWSFMGPLVALLFFHHQKAMYWFAAYIFNLFVTIIFNDFFALHGQEVSENLRIFFIAMNLGVSSLVVYIFAAYFVNTALAERDRANGLLLNILPAPIAARLKLHESPISNDYQSITVLFADIVGFTEWSEKLSSDETIDFLNDIFSRFDALVESKGLEKIKTIGDGYMVVGGAPKLLDDHAAVMLNLASEMLEEMQRFNMRRGLALDLRIGLNTGPAVAGVIGAKKFSYDLWGDTINTASRMESYGVTGRVQVTQDMYELLKDRYEFEDRGLIEVKSKGRMQVYLLA